MNDVFRPDSNDPIERYELDGPTFRRGDEKSSRDVASACSCRRGGRLFAFGGSLLLAGGLLLGGWGNYSLRQEVMATATQERDFVPSLRAATVVANPATVTVTLPGTTAAFAAANIYARATGYIAQRNRRHWRSHQEQGICWRTSRIPETRPSDAARTKRHSISSNRHCSRHRANRDLAQVTWDRDAPLIQEGLGHSQQGDTDRLGLQARVAAWSRSPRLTSRPSRICSKCCGRTGTMHRSSHHSTVLSPSAKSMLAASSKVMRQAAPSCSGRLCSRTVSAYRFTIPQGMRHLASRQALRPSCAKCPNLPIASSTARKARIAEALQSGTRTLLTEIDIANSDGALINWRLLHGRAPYPAPGA